MASTPPAPGATTTTTVPYNALEAQYPLLYTGPVVEGLLYATEVSITPIALTRPDQVMGTATARWGGSTRSEPAVATTAATLLGVPGQRITSTITPLAHSEHRAVPDQVGDVRFTLGTESTLVPVARQGDLALPNWTWRLIHG